MTAILDGTLLLVGAGKMGMALLEGLVRKGVSPQQILVQDPAPTADVKKRLAELGIACAGDQPQNLAQSPTVVLLAVKPQILTDVLPAIAKLCGSNTLVLSVIAGKPLPVLSQGAGAGRAVVRAMPNTPAAIGAGMTVCIANAHVTEAQRACAHAIFAAAGEVAWIDDETQMDAVTAVSGSGPAYVFLLAEAMTDAGTDAGLDRELAATLARATVSGAGQLLSQSQDDAETLRKAVTSPGGTTAAALQVLMEHDRLKTLVRDAVHSAQNRSRELAS